MVLHLIQQPIETHNASILFRPRSIQARHVVVVVRSQSLAITVQALCKPHVPDMLRIDETTIIISCI